MFEYDPNHPATRTVREQWHKFCAILMLRMGRTSVDITREDVDQLLKADVDIVVDTRSGGLTLRLVSPEEGERLAREEGGLPA